VTIFLGAGKNLFLIGIYGGECNDYNVDMGRGTSLALPRECSMSKCDLNAEPLEQIVPQNAYLLALRN